MITIIPAQSGWKLHYIDDETNMPFGPPSIPDPIVAWRVELDGDKTYCEPIVIGEPIINPYWFEAPDGSVVVPDMSTYASMAEALEQLEHLRK